MKIGIDISQIVYPGTGVATYTRFLVENLLKVDKDNDYLLYGSSLRQLPALKQFAKGKKVTTSFWPIPPTAATVLWNKARPFPIETLIGNVDLFHTSDWTQPRTTCPKVTTIHDLIVYKYPQTSHEKTEFRTDVMAPSPNIVANQKRTLDLAKKECRLIIVDSEATKKDCEEVLGIPASKMRVVYLAPGNNVNEFMAQSKEIREKAVKAVQTKYGLKKKYFLFAGTRGPRKNLDRLIEAYQALNSSDTELVLVGNYGWGAKQKEIPGVRVLGFLPQEELAPLWHGAFAFTFPSIYEGFGVPILESMVLNCPVLTANVSSMPEAGGDAAIYVDPMDIKSITGGLKRMMALTPSKRKELISKGVKQAAKFTWEKTAKQTLEVYKEAALME